MTDHRYEAHAKLAGERELVTDGHLIELITLTLTDAGPVAGLDGSEHHRPDVICPLRPSQARTLAGRLLALADHAEPPALTR
jgi:hypothetical protein